MRTVPEAMSIHVYWRKDDNVLLYESAAHLTHSNSRVLLPAGSVHSR